MLKQTVWGRVPSRSSKHIPYIVSIDGDLMSLPYRDIRGSYRRKKVLVRAYKGKQDKYVVCNTKNIAEAYIHRVMLMTFKPTEVDDNVNHINGIKDDNRLENLEWCTVRYNIQHAIKNKLRSSCSVAGWNKGLCQTYTTIPLTKTSLSENLVKQIKKLKAEGNSVKSIVQLTGKCRSAIRPIYKAEVVRLCSRGSNTYYKELKYD